MVWVQTAGMFQANFAGLFDWSFSAASSTTSSLVCFCARAITFSLMFVCFPLFFFPFFLIVFGGGEQGDRVLLIQVCLELWWTWGWMILVSWFYCLQFPSARTTGMTCYVQLPASFHYMRWWWWWWWLWWWWRQWRRQQQQWWYMIKVGSFLLPFCGLRIKFKFPDL